MEAEEEIFYQAQEPFATSTREPPTWIGRAATTTRPFSDTDFASGRDLNAVELLPPDETLEPGGGCGPTSASSATAPPEAGPRPMSK